MADQYDSRVDVLYVYKYLHDALDGDHEHLAQQISDLSSSMARAFKGDTGITVGEAIRREEPTYRIWWQDGSQAELFAHEKILDMAARFDFDAYELIENGEIEMIDDGQVIGGVIKQ
jgi:hypothetical protein